MSSSLLMVAKGWNREVRGQGLEGEGKIEPLIAYIFRALGADARAKPIYCTPGAHGPETWDSEMDPQPSRILGPIYSRSRAGILRVSMAEMKLTAIVLGLPDDH